MSSCESSTESSWIEDEEKCAITFDLPASDFELVQQVFEFIDENQDVNRGDILLRMARKYRFAGYIGTIEYLSAEIRELSDEIDTIRDELKLLKNKIPPQSFLERWWRSWVFSWHT
jgi:hypothetical protein